MYKRQALMDGLISNVKASVVNNTRTRVVADLQVRDLEHLYLSLIHIYSRLEHYDAHRRRDTLLLRKRPDTRLCRHAEHRRSRLCLLQYGGHADAAGHSPVSAQEPYPLEKEAIRNGYI